MAGKEVVKDKAVKGEEGKDAFSGILEKAQEIRLTGHPAADPGESDDALLERQLKEKAAKKEEEPSEEEERISAPDGKEPEEEEETEAKEKTPRKPKFETVEEADKALQEAERKMHTATQEAAENRKLLSNLQDQMNTLLLAQVEGKKEKEKAEKELQTKEIKDGQKTSVKEMLKITRNLDPEDPDYDEKYAAAMSALFDRQEEDLRKRLKGEVKDEVVREFPAPSNGKEQKLRESANRLAKAAGLDMNPEVSLSDDGDPIPSADYELFWQYVYDTPGKTLKEQVDNTVKKVARVKKSYQDPLLKAKGKGNGKEKEAEEEILERSGSETVERTPKLVKPMSLDDTLKEVNRRRTL